MGIGDEPGKPFIVPLKRLSLELVQNVFMTIEEPEDPLTFPVIQALEAATAPQFHTIGEFYLALDASIQLLGNSIFTGDPKRQVTGWFRSDDLFAVTDTASASRAIRVIVEQGEGTRKKPVDFQGQFGHYYLFAEIVNGKRLIVDAKYPDGYAYAGDPIPFDASGVYPMVDNPPLVELPADTLVARYADQFDQTYTTLLNALQATMSGAPAQLGASIGVMYDLRLQAQQLMTTPIPGLSGVNAGPRWRFAG
jgi:hypothetical protein